MVQANLVTGDGNGSIEREVCYINSFMEEKLDLYHFSE